MEGQIAAPLHFAVEFLVLAVAAGAGLQALRSWRAGGGGALLPQGLAFLALAVAQGLHGALAIVEDGAVPLLVLRGGAFALVALPLTRRPAGALPALFVAGGDADWAAVPAALAAVVSARAYVAARRGRDRAAGAYAGAFAAFAASEVALVAAPSDGGAWLAAAHVARAAGGLLLARWLWSGFTTRIRLRFVAAFVAALLVVVLVVSLALNVVLAGNLEREEQRRLEIAGRAQIQQLAVLGANAQDSAREIARSERVAEQIVARASELLQRSAAALLRAFTQRVDFLLFVDARGRVLASAEGTTPRPIPRSQGLALAGSDVVAEVLNRGRVVSSADSVAGTQVVVIGAAPVRPRGAVIGAVALGVRVNRLVPLLADNTASDVSLVVGGAVQRSTLGRAAAVNRSFRELMGRVRQIRETGTSLVAAASLGGERTLSALVPVERTDGVPVGVLVFSRPTEVLAGSQRSLNRTLFLVMLGASALAALAAWLSGARVTRPIGALTTAAEQLRRGNLDARASVDAADEIGALGSTFNEMAASLQRMTGDLRTAAAQREAIMQSMGDGLIATDEGGRVVAFNRAAEEMVGRRPEAAVGRPLAEALAGTSGTGRPLAEAALAGVATEATIDRPDGGHVPVALTSAPLRDGSGRATGRVIVFRDMSREREAERMKSEFLSNVSHELRTPLTPIKGYVEMMKRRRLPREKELTFLNAIGKSGARLERVVDMLVDYAAIEAGRLTPQAEPVALRPLLDGVLGRWREEAAGHRFVCRAAADLPPVAADGKRLERAVNELIDNAVKFSPKGGRVDVSAEVVRERVRGRGPAMRIDVRDRGIGIGSEQMSALFQDFRQLDGSETRAYGGLGLGLAYAKRVATAFGGDIVARSAPGRGSTFSILLPLADTGRRRRPAVDRRRARKPVRTRKTRKGRSRR